MAVRMLVLVLVLLWLFLLSFVMHGNRHCWYDGSSVRTVWCSSVGATPPRTKLLFLLLLLLLLLLLREILCRCWRRYHCGCSRSSGGDTRGQRRQRHSRNQRPAFVVARL